MVAIIFTINKNKTNKSSKIVKCKPNSMAFFFYIYLRAFHTLIISRRAINNTVQVRQNERQYWLEFLKQNLINSIILDSYLEILPLYCNEKYLENFITKNEIHST